jgi:uncharacterized membrane protein YfcA
MYMIALALVFAALSFSLSASAGLGGSLILVPGLSLLLGPKQGIALASLLLALQNVAKIIAYRQTLPFKPALAVLLLTMLGTGLGARLLVSAPETWVSAAILVAFAMTFLFERIQIDRLRKGLAPLLAFVSGATSGFSGTSGPLKGVALRSLGFDRLHFVGAASLVSFAGDAVKTAVFAEAALLDRTSWTVALLALPLMPLAAYAGRQLNRKIGERAFAGLFWAVIAGYSVRLLMLAR